MTTFTPRKSIPNIHLCPLCLYIFTHFDARHYHFNKEHYNLIDLSTSAVNGCRLCRFLVQKFGDEGCNLEALVLRKARLFLLWTLGHAYDASLTERNSLGLVFFLVSENGSFKNESILQITSTPSVESFVTPRIIVPMATDNESTWFVAKNWIDACANTNAHHVYYQMHHHCRRIIMDRRPPARLVYIPEDLEKIRLHMTSVMDGDLKYATLTHCWGQGPMPMKLVQSNLAELLQQVKFHALSKTFRDAVTITRRLGYKYLWIDSLCIIQDDTEDWLAESGIMGSIYAGCIVNIVAADSPDGSVGCFFDRSPSYDHGFKAYASNGREGEDQLELRNWYCEPSRAMDFTRNRSWCFQETLLSPRSIFFRRDQIHFECRVLKANEAFPQGPNSDAHLIRSKTLEWNLLGAMSTGYVIKEWFHLVEEYSAGNLSYWSDRLPAISGVAQAFSKSFGLHSSKSYRPNQLRYFAGLWRRGLEKQLCWRTNNRSERDYLPSRANNVPTWSWASVNGSISIHGPNIDAVKVNFRIVDVQVELAGNDEYGDVQSGRLTLQCHHLIPIRAVFDEDGGRHYFLSINGTVFKKAWIFQDEPIPECPLFALHGWAANEYDEVGITLAQVEEANTYRRVGQYSIGCWQYEEYPDLHSLLPFHGTIGNQRIITII